VALLVGATVLVTVAVLVMEGSDALGVGAELKLGVREGGIKIVEVGVGVIVFVGTVVVGQVVG
jgi:hypothetical protein